MNQRFGRLPPPVLPALAAAYPELLEARTQAAGQQRSASQSNLPMERVRWHLCKVSIITTETNSPFHSLYEHVHLIHSRRLRLVTCLALLRLHLIPWLLWVPPAVQDVRMFGFFIVFSGRLAPSWSDICFQVICIYFEYIHEMGVARHFEVFL